MPAAVLLQDIVHAMDVPDSEWESFLNRETGETVTVSDEDRRALEEATDDLPEWQREILPKIREAVESDRYLQLPDQFEIDEWSIMERFARSRQNPEIAEELLDAIHGAGAFRLFRNTIDRLGIEKDWYRFRDESLKSIARDWLAGHGIPYK